jgi:hypothetical protein
MAIKFAGSFNQEAFKTLVCLKFFSHSPFIGQSNVKYTFIDSYGVHIQLLEKYLV